MTNYLLVFDDGNGSEVGLQAFVDSLDPGAEIFTLDGHVCFLKSALSASVLADRFLRFAGSSIFYLTEMSTANFSGRMPGVFWDFLKHSSTSMESAAE
jgi:hypothetical protein